MNHAEQQISRTNLQRMHFLVGSTGVGLFVISGLYMHFWFDHLKSVSSLVRLMYRSGHIYLLAASLVNLMLGCYVVQISQGIARRIQLIGSVFLLPAPVLLCVGFLLESQSVNLLRPITGITIVVMFLGALLHVLAVKRLATRAGGGAG